MRGRAGRGRPAKQGEPMISATPEFKERNRRVFQEELEEFVPAKILDFHVHVFDAATSPTKNPFNAGGETRGQYTYEELDGDLAEIYPGRKTSAVCFGIPHVDSDLTANNRYVAATPDPSRFFALRLFDPHEADRAGVIRDLQSGKFFGIKPYVGYPRKPDVNQVEIHDMVPAWIMRAVHDLGQIVMLHIPRKARLADPVNQRQLVELAREYPKAKIVVAHVGRAYYLKNVLGKLDALKPYANLYFDLTMVNHWEVMEHLFQTIPAERIVYGTDIPIALAPGKSVEINDQYSYVTPQPWDLSITDSGGRSVFTAFLYEELRAIRHAVERCGLPRSFVEGVFHEHGRALLASVKGGEEGRAGGSSRGCAPAVYAPVGARRLTRVEAGATKKADPGGSAVGEAS